MFDYANRIDKRYWFVRDADIKQARKMIVEYHYAKGCANTAVAVHGLFDCIGDLCGVAWWMPPIRAAAAAAYHDPTKVLALSRLVIAPGVPKNACSFLISRSIKMIDKNKWPCLVTYADSWQGHRGTIYKATNWEEVGETKPEKCYVKDGRMLSRKAGPKTRTHAEMLALGAEYIGSFSKIKFRMIRK